MSETISSNDEQTSDDSIWGGEYSKNVPEFSGDRKFVKFEDIANICNFDNSMLYGHGTGTSGNGHEVVESIFEEGVKGHTTDGKVAGEVDPDEILGSTDLTDGTVPLWSPASGEMDLSAIKSKLDNWPHRNSENVILMRFPLEYYHLNTGVFEERALAYFTVHDNEVGHPTHYIDRRLIIGNYNTKTGAIELNPHFEPEISDGFKQELDKRLEEVKKRTEERLKDNENRPFPSVSRDQYSSDETKLEDNAVDDSDWIY